MSSTLSTIPKLNGVNYKCWAQDMEAYLRATGIWHKSMAGTTATPEEEEAMDKWDENDDQTLGSICLCIEPSISATFQAYNTGKELWDALKAKYEAASLASAFTEWKIMLGISFPDNNHPGPAFSKLNSSFAQLEQLQHKIPDNLKALITVAKLPKYAETLHQTLNKAIDADPTKTKVKTMVELETILTAAWQHYLSCRPPPRVEANKVSNIHHQNGNPNFKQQQKKEESSSNKKDENKDKGKKRHQGKHSEEGEKKCKDHAAAAAKSSSTSFHPITPTI